jgi:hypothetical protein
MAARSATRSARRLALLASTALLSTAMWLTAAGPTFACSCVGSQPMATYATAEYAVFSGTTGPSDARGVPVRVAQWFSGPGPAPIVWLAASSFGDGASCGTSKPAAGTEWIWVTWLPEDGGDPATGLCNPHGELGTPEGDALLADATTTFGGVAPPGTTATDPPATAPEPPNVSPDAAFPILVGTLGLGLVVLLGVVVVAGRRTRKDP